MIFTTTDTKLVEHDGKECDIVRSLTNSEADLIETGPMFVVRVSTGERITAFADELS